MALTLDASGAYLGIPGLLLWCLPWWWKIRQITQRKVVWALKWTSHPNNRSIMLSFEVFGHVSTDMFNKISVGTNCYATWELVPSWTASKPVGDYQMTLKLKT